MIEIRDLTKRFGPILAVDGVTFNVVPGEILGFLGPNGAGKSTTMKMVTGFLAPTRGTAVVNGHDVVSAPQKVKESIGYLPEGAPAYPDMTPESFLRFIAEVRGYRGPQRQARVDRAVELADLNEVYRQPIDTLSKGFKRRVGLAQAILHDPPVLIMDEPTDGLDPNQKRDVRRLIRQMAEAPADGAGAGDGGRGAKAIILSTHILEEVEAVCSRVVVIARGRIAFDGSPEEFAARSRHHQAVYLEVRADKPDTVLAEISGLAHVREVERLAAARAGMLACMVFPKKGQTVAADLARHARQQGWEVDALRVEHGRLDDVFREMTLTAGGGRGREQRGTAR